MFVILLETVIVRTRDTKEAEEERLEEREDRKDGEQCNYLWS